MQSYLFKLFILQAQIQVSKSHLNSNLALIALLKEKLTTLFMYLNQPRE